MADDKEIEEITIADANVVKKYKTAGDIVNKTLTTLIQSCIAGASVKALCEKGDKLIVQETDKKYKNEDIRKGIAFPTCLSVNNCICHFSPSKNDTDYVLKAEDVVKIDLGAHIDGFIAVVAHTLVVGASPTNKTKGRKSDVVLAAHYAGQAALRLLTSGKNNYGVTDAVQEISESFKCKPIEGMLSHQLKQFKIDGEKTIIQNPTKAQKKEHEKCDFENYEVYAMDVLISTGEGLGKELDTKVSIYKKTEENYLLKLKTSRMFYAEVKKKYGSMPFNLRNFEEEAKAKMGVVECVAHKLIEPFQVLYEKHSEYVAQFKYTVLLFPNGIQVLTGNNLNTENYESEYSISEEMKTLVNSELKFAEETKKVKDKKPRKPKKGKGDKDKENTTEKSASSESAAATTDNASVASSETKAN